VANVLNNPELSNPQKEKEIEKILVEAEKDPKEGSKKFKAIAGKILEGLGGWMAESTKETLEGGMLRFIRALFEGANYNSGSSLRNSEAENPDDAIPSADFFTLMREKPQEAIAKLLDSSSKLKGAGWEIRDKGLELLRKGKDNPNFAKEALMAVLIGSDQEGITSLSDHLASVDDNERWKDIGPILAQELFDKKMLSFSIKKELKELRSGNQDPNNKAYFGS